MEWFGLHGLYVSEMGCVDRHAGGLILMQCVLSSSESRFCIPPVSLFFFFWRTPSNFCNAPHPSQEILALVIVVDRTAPIIHET
mmetsp:Transcript_83312/g.97371  ORF Transcript_83312/g.97371 Transcript_83312/m.97371 type:complete len:84 (+) Transcript_83312:71-322(+)